MARAAYRVVVGAGDQLVYSFTNFALTVFVARSSSPAEFGGYSLLLATWVIASAVNRGLVAEPLIILHSATADSVRRAAAERGLRRAFALGVPVGTAFAVVPFVAGLHVMTPLCVVFGVAMPFLFAQDLLRFAGLALGRPGASLTSDVVAAILQIGASVVLVVAGSDTQVALVTCWAVAAATGATLEIASLRLRPLRRGTVAADDREMAARLAADNFVAQGGQQAVGYVVAVFAGFAAAGGFRAAQSVMLPLGILSLGTHSALLPEFVRLRRRSLSAVGRGVRIVSASLALIGISYYLLVVELVPDRFGRFALGPSWDAGRSVLPFVGWGIAMGFLTVGGSLGLRALGDTRRALQARTLSMLLLVIILVPACATAGVTGAGWAVAIGGTLQGVVWYVSFLRADRAAEQSSAPVRGHPTSTESGAVAD